MKLNNKGFMLAEIIVTSVTVMVTLVTLYATFSKVYVGFNKKNNYDNVDAKYAARGLYDVLISSSKINEYVASLSSNFKVLDKNNHNQIKDLYNKYKIVDAVLIEYDEKTLFDDDTIADLYDSVSIKEKMRDYVKYLSTSLDFVNKPENINYILIVELSDNCEDVSGSLTCEEDESNNYFGYYLIP